MPAAQGRIPKIVLPGRMVGKNVNGSATNDSIEYRGRPYSTTNAIEQASIDFNREQNKMAWQKGLRVIGVYLTTGRILPQP